MMSYTALRATVAAFLLVTSLAGVAPASPAPSTSVPDPAPIAHSLSDSVLPVGRPARGTVVETSLDVSAALTVARDRARSKLDRYTFTRRFRQVDDSTRIAMLIRVLDTIESRQQALRATARRLRRGFANGTVSETAFLRGFALVSAKAQVLDKRLAVLERLASNVSTPRLTRRIRRLDVALVGFMGPIRNRLVEALSGRRSPFRLFAEASSHGVALSMFAGDEYIREVYRADFHEPLNTTTISFESAVTRATELYPNAYNSPDTIRTGIQGFSGDIYRISIHLRQGSITSYLDGSTNEVFYEIQRRILSRLVPAPGPVASANGTRLVVNRTYPGGPLRIATYNNETGEPVESTIFVDGRRHGTTGNTVWVLAPRRVRFTVTAVRPSGNVSVSVRPIFPASADESDR